MPDASELRLAGEAALRRYEWESARLLLLQAIELHESPEALELLTRASRWLLDESGTIDAGERAFLIYQRRREPIAAARVATWLAIDVLELRGHDSVANGWLARAHRLLDELPHVPEHGWLAGVEAYLALLGRNDAPTAVLLADDALAIGLEVGANDLTMVAIAVKGLALVTMGDIARGMPLLDEACTAAIREEIEDPTMRSTILCALMDACDRVRDFERASQWSSRIREAADRWGLPAVITVCRPHFAVVLTWKGLWREAEHELESAIEEYQQIRPLLVVEGVVRFAELRLRQGKVDEARVLFAQVEHEGLAQVGRAELALADNDPRLALEVAERFIRRIPASDRIERAPGLEVLARAAIACSDLNRAEAAAGELQAIAGSVGTGPLRAGAAYVGGLVAAAVGDDERARRSLEIAADGYAKEGAPFELGRARVALGDLLLRVGNATAAQHEWQGALALFQGIGAAGESGRTKGRLEELARLHGTASDAVVHLLSDREREILGYVARGLRNGEIAEALVLSPRTIERHISNIYAKLGLSGSAARAAAATEAFRLGLISLAEHGEHM